MWKGKTTAATMWDNREEEVEEAGKGEWSNEWTRKGGLLARWMGEGRE